MIEEKKRIEKERKNNYSIENYSINRMNFILISNYSGKASSINEENEKLFDYKEEDLKYLKNGFSISYGLPREAPSFRNAQVFLN